jgi:hypothetical protein
MKVKFCAGLPVKFSFLISKRRMPPKLGVFSGADVCRILEQNGFVFVRQRGSNLSKKLFEAG